MPWLTPLRVLGQSKTLTLPDPAARHLEQNITELQNFQKAVRCGSESLVNQLLEPGGRGGSFDLH